MVEDEEVMELDEIRAYLLENGIDMDAENDDQNFPEEILEDDSMVQDEGNGITEKEDLCVNAKGSDLVAGDLAKAEGTRKRLFKPSMSTVGSTNMRLAAMLLSPRKRAAAKAGGRPGGGTKRMDDKGTSNPKTNQKKP